MEDIVTYQHQVISYSINILLSLLVSIGGTSWSKASLPSGYWRAVASDSTGRYLAVVNAGNAGVAGGYIYTSASGS